MKAILALLLICLLLPPSSSLGANRIARTGQYALVPDTGQNCVKLRPPYDNISTSRVWELWDAERKVSYSFGEAVCNPADLHLYRVKVAMTKAGPKADSTEWTKLEATCSAPLEGYTLGANAVAEQQGFTISALQANVADFKEFKGLSQKRGEVALVVSARERTDSKQDFGGSAASKGRVVFFQENVGAGTPLNFSNLPIYGPAVYGGYPLSLTLQFVEVDAAERRIMSTLIPSAIKLARSFTGVNPAVSGFLDSIGNLLTNNKDDIILEYHMEFDPPMRKSNAASPVLEYGTYVYLSTEDPTEWVSWNAVRFKKGDGRLYKDPSCTTPLKDQSWVSFQIKPANREKIVKDAEFTRLGDILAAQAATHENKALALAKTLEAFTVEQKSELAFSKYLGTAVSVRGKKPEDFEPNAKVVLGQMLVDIDNHFKSVMPTSGVILSLSMTKRLLQELRNAEISQDAALPLSYEGFSLEAAKASLKLAGAK